ncbi:MAG: TIR domain-containing protein [Methylococcales bacterium]
MTGIFISYRRDDVTSDAGRLYDDLEQRSENDDGYIFMDVNDIPPGQPFPVYLHKKLESCSVLLALIGPRWLSIADEKTGVRRLAMADDWVRREIVSALEQKKQVIPILLQGAKMPAQADLPEELHGLAALEAIDMHSQMGSAYWHLRLSELISVLPGIWRPERDGPAKVTWKSWLQVVVPGILLLTTIHLFMIWKRIDFDPAYLLMALSPLLGYYAQRLGFKVLPHVVIGLAIPVMTGLLASVILYFSEGGDILPQNNVQIRLFGRFVAGIFIFYMLGAMVLRPLLQVLRRLLCNFRKPA